MSRAAALYLLEARASASLSVICRQAAGVLTTTLALLGMAVGAAFVLEPVILTAARGVIAWRVFISTYFLLAASAVVFLVSYVGFPIWAFWLGREFQHQS